MKVEAAKGFLRVLRQYLDSLCSNLRSHTITNVQSNDDKVRALLQHFTARFVYLFKQCETDCSKIKTFYFQVSLLLKESFIESFPYRDRPFMKVKTQLSTEAVKVLNFIDFTVHLISNPMR